MNRQDIFDEVSAERAIQDMRWGGPANDDLNSPADWVAITCRHLGMAACDTAAAGDEERFRRQMVRVAALAVAAIESRGRITAARCVAGPVTTGSGW